MGKMTLNICIKVGRHNATTHKLERGEKMMGKGKMKIDAIEDVSDRKTSYRKRKNTLMRKLDEITALCGVEASMIIVSELEEGGGVKTWPEDPEVVGRLLEKFKDVRETEMGKKREHDMYELVEEREKKEKLTLEKLKAVNEENEGRRLLSYCLGGMRSVKDLNEGELTGLENAIDGKLKCLNRRMKDLMKAENADHVEVEDDFGDSDPERYLNFDVHEGIDAYGGNWVNLLGAEVNFAVPETNGRGWQDQAGPSETNGHTGMSGWGRGGGNNGDAA